MQFTSKKYLEHFQNVLSNHISEITTTLSLKGCLLNNLTYHNIVCELNYSQIKNLTKKF